MVVDDGIISRDKIHKQSGSISTGRLGSSISSLSDKSSSDRTENTMGTSTAPDIRSSPKLMESWSSMMSLKSWTSSKTVNTKRSRSDAILQTGDIQFAKGNYEEAIHYYDKFLTFAKTKYPYSDEKVIIAYERVAHAQAMCNEKMYAVVNYRNAISGLEFKMQETEQNIEDVEYEGRLRKRFSRILINCGNTLLKISEESKIQTEIAAYCDQAIDYYKEALPLVQEQHGVYSSESMALAQRFCLARDSLIKNIYANKHHKAAVQYKENIAFLKPYIIEMAKESHIRKIQTNKYYKSILALFSRQTINLGLLYLKQDRLDDVLELFGDSLRAIGLSENNVDEKILEILPEVVTKLLSTLLHNMGVVCQKKNLPFQAALHYSRVVFLKKKYDLCPGFSLLGLGESYFELAQYSQALKNLLEAEKQLHFDQGNTYNEAYDMCFSNIATIYESKEDIGNCITYLKKQIQFLRKCLTCATELGQRESSIWHRIACIYFEVGDFDDALYAHKQSLAHRRKIGNPSDLSLTLQHIGQILFKTEKFEVAFNSYNESLEYLVDTEKIATLYEMGNCLFQMKSDYEAIEQYESCLSLASKLEAATLDAHVITSCVSKLGLLLTKLEGYNRAIANYQDALKLINEISTNIAKEKMEILLGLGNAYLGLCDYDLAMRHYIKAKEILPTDDVSLHYCDLKKCVFCIADVHEKKNEIDQCLLTLTDFITLAKENIKDERDCEIQVVANLHKIACVQFRAQRNDDSLKTYQRILSVKVKACRYDTSDSTAKEDVSLAFCEIGSVYVKKKLYKDALNNYKRALTDVERTTKALVLCEIGKVLVLLNRYDEASYTFESALSRVRNESIPKVLLHIATFHATVKKFDEAVEHYEKALLHQNKEYIEERGILKRCLEDRKLNLDNVEALQWFYSVKNRLKIEDFCTTYGNIESVTNDIINHFLRNNDLDSCITCLKCTINIAKLFIVDKTDLSIKITQSLDKMGYLQQKARYNDNAIESYEHSMRIKEMIYSSKNPDTSLTYHSIGEVYVVKGEYQYALNNLREALKGAFEEDKIVLLDKIGMCLHKMGHVDGAKDCYKSALLLCENKHTVQRVLLLNNLGNVNFCTGNLNDALSCYIEAQASSTAKQNLCNDSEFILLNLGLLYYNKNSCRQSFESFKTFLSTRVSEIVLKNDSFDLNIAYVLNYFGFLLFKQRFYREAIEWFQHSINLMYSLPIKNEELLNRVVSNLGSSYFCLHEYDSAWPLLIQVIQAYKQMANKNERLLVSLLLKCARINFQKKKYNSSLDEYQQACSLMRKNGQLRGELITMHNIALVYCKKRLFIEASKLLDEVRNKKIMRYGKNHPEVAKVLIDLGYLNLKMREYTEADKFIYQASDMLVRAKCPLDHPYLVQLENAMAKLNKRAEIMLANRKKRKNIDTRTRRGMSFLK